MTAPKRYCIDCWLDISKLRRDSVRCRDCAVYYQKHGGYQKKLSETARREARQKRELVAAEYGTTRLKVFEYQGQELATQGRFLIVVGTGETKYIARRCHDCKRDDSQIKGQWAPAFAESWGQREIEKIILLCRNCYQRRCENFN